MKNKRGVPKLEAGTYRHSDLKFRVSSIVDKGLGLVALTEIEEDFIIDNLDGCIKVTKEEASKSPERNYFYSYGLLDNNSGCLIVSAGKTLSLWSYMNHSIKPNVYFDGYNFKTLRKISEGEELVFSYPAADHNEDESYQF